MIQLARAQKRFGPKLLFDELDWLITPQDRVGLVGANGTGKTTLLKIIAGLEQIDQGGYNAQRGVRIGYLPQDGLRMTGRTVFAECLSVFEDLKQIEIEMAALQHQMGELDPAGPEYRQVAERFHKLDSEFRNRDGYALEAHAGTVLAGLGFPKDDWTRPCEEFSGGWQMRIALAKLLLARPDMLLLDEPTNHLDLEARNWLEEYLNNYPSAFVLISHDRFFLDATVRRVAEIWNKRVTLYAGNYSRYLSQKQMRMETLRAAQRNQQERIEQLESFISRFRAQATKAKQVQSRIKELEKIERIDLPPEEQTIHFSFPQPPPSGRVVAEFEGVDKSYGTKQVLRQVRFIIERGDRVALVGHNGAGKSTLIKLLSGSEPLTAGDYKLGHNVTLEYFAQDQYKELDPNAQVLDDIWSLSPRRSQTEIRTLLGCFLFSEEDVYKRIGVLSGGERNRYALARMLLTPANFLLLDEPTNHLDLRAKDVLLDALRAFTGTLVFVSHDRYFIDQLATRVFEIADGSVTIYPGNYEEYLRRKAAPDDPPAAVAPTLEPEPESVKAPLRQRLNPQLVKKIENRMGAIEERLTSLEDSLSQAERELTVFVSADRTQELTRQMETQRSEVSALESEWEQLATELEDARGGK